MEQREFWTIVGVAIVVAVLASAITASITGNVIYAKLVKANSCDADSICEINAASAKTIKVGISPSGNNPAFYVNNLGGYYDEVQINTKTTFNDIVRVNSGISASTGKFEGDLTLTTVDNNSSGVILKTVLDQLVVSASLSRFQGIIASNNLVGNGTAYVCVNDKGILTRSYAPCR